MCPRRSMLLMLALAGCGSGRQTAVVATGAAVAVGSIALAAAANDAPGDVLAAEIGAGAAAAVIPVLLADHFFGGEETEPTTEGDIYSGLARALLGSLVVGTVSTAPGLATFATGESLEGSRHPGRALTLALVAGGLPVVFSAANRDRLPKWVRFGLAITLAGSLATLGYQAGGGGPE